MIVVLALTWVTVFLWTILVAHVTGFRTLKAPRPVEPEIVAAIVSANVPVDALVIRTLRGQA